MRSRGQRASRALLAPLLLFLSHFLVPSPATPVFVPQFLSGGTGRNIRHLPCVSRRTGETGTCMFAFTCAKANGTHLGTCIDRFYFGSCCKLDQHHPEPEVASPQDNAIDVDSSPKPFVDSNDVPGNVDKSKPPPPPPSLRLTTKSATRTTTTAKPPTKFSSSKRPVTLLDTTTESIRLSTFQTVSNALEQRPTTLPSSSSSSSFVTSTPTSTTKRKQTTASATRPRPTYSNSATSPAVTLTTSASFSPQTPRPTTVAYGQYLTSKKPVSTLKATATTTTTSTTTTRRPVPSPFPSTSSSSSSSTFGSSSSRPSFGSTLSQRNVTSTIVVKTPSSTTSFKPSSTSPVTVRTPTVTRFPPRNATTTENVDIVTTTTRDVEETLKPISSTRKPTTTKKPIRPTTKKPTSKPRPSSTLVTKKPTIATSPVSSTSGQLKTTTPASSTTKTSSTSAPSVSTTVTITTTKKTTTSWPTKKPLTTTTASKKPSPTTTTTSIKVTSKKPAVPSSSSTSATTVTAVKKNATSTSADKPTTTSPSKLASPTTKKPTTTAKPITEAVTEKQSIASSAASSSTKFTTRPTARPTTFATKVTAAPSTSSSSSTPGSKNNTFVAATTVSNEIDTEFEDTNQGPTLTSGIVTWSSFSDELESTTKPAEFAATVTADTTTERDWTSVTPPEGWIFIPSATSAKPALETAATTQAPPTAAQAKPAVTDTTTSTKQTTTTTTTTPTPTPAPSLPSSPSATSPAPLTASPAATSTTTEPSSIIWPSATPSTTYMDVLSTLATVTVAPDFSDTPFSSLNMSNFKEVCGRRLFPESRIVGGDPSNFGRWPWQISLRQWRTSTYLHKCGAALLNENWAITAAHCVQNVLPSDLLLRIGEHDLGHEEEPYGFQERRIQIVASHPNFDPRTFEYDLALMRFYEPVLPFQPNILPICVPDDDEDFVGEHAFVTGWGRLYEDGPLPSVLQEVAVPVINNSVCEGMYRNAGYIEHIPHIFICAGWRKGGYDSCEGDSGGPLVIQRKRDKRWVLAGVISWGIGCAEPNQPGVYTRISEFREWINQILQF